MENADRHEIYLNRFLEQSSTMLEQRCDLQSSSVQTLTKLSAVEKEKNDLLIELNEAKVKIVELQNAFSDVTKTKESENNEELTMKYENAKLASECQAFEKSCKDLRQCLASTEETLRQEQLKTTDLETRLKTLNSMHEANHSQSNSELEAANRELQIWMNKVGRKTLIKEHYIV